MASAFNTYNGSLTGKQQGSFVSPAIGRISRTAAGLNGALNYSIDDKQRGDGQFIYDWGNSYNNLYDWASNSGAEKKSSGSPYVGPNYTALAASNKANAERQIPILQQNYQNSLGDILNNLQLARDQDKAAEDLARSDFNAANRNQISAVSDMWYMNQQKMNNLYSGIRNNINNQYGSINRSKDFLMNKTDDQADVTDLTNLKHGLFDNLGTLNSKLNNIYQTREQNNVNIANQISDLQNQWSSAMANYATDFLGQQSAYYDRQLQDSSGNLTQAGWDWVYNNLGLKNDGSGRYEADYSKLIANTGMTLDEFNSMLSDLKTTRVPLVTTDMLPTFRSLDQTTNYVRGQAGRNRAETQKASYTGANSKYYAPDMTLRYG